MRRELKTFVEHLNIFLEQDNELKSIFNEIYPNYLKLIECIQDKIKKPNPLIYDDITFRVNLQKLLLFLNKIVEIISQNNKYDEFIVDINTVKNKVNEQMEILKRYYGKDVFWGYGKVSLTETHFLK